MDKLVIFKFLHGGSFEQGFLVTAQIWSDGKVDSEIDGRLPPAPEIVQDYERWQEIYFRLGHSLRCLPFRELTAPPAQVTNFSIADCKNAALALRDRLNTWLQSGSFPQLKEEVLMSLNTTDEVRVFIQTPENQMQRLPWHECEFFARILQNFRNAEIVLSVKHKKQTASPRQGSILAIFGGSLGIDTIIDASLLKQYANKAVTLLSQPTRKKLNSRLWEQGWSILFFAGHSQTQDNREGRFYINDNEYLTIDDLMFALQIAVRNGLKLAIFNSCDGLGLAQALADLRIPHVIVMREPVPDSVAQEFLQHFLSAFTNGKSLDVALREARERLQGLEGQYPCASWFPISFGRPYEKPLTWKDLSHNPIMSPKRLLIAGATIAAIALGAHFAIVSLSIIGWRWWIENPKNQIKSGKEISVNPVPEAALTWISSGDKILVESVTNPYKQEGVQAFAKGYFDTAERKFAASLGAHRNDPEALIYLNNAKIGNSKAWEIAVSVPISSNLNVAQEILRGVAQQQDEFNKKGGSNGMLLKVAIADDKNDPDFVKKIATEFVKDADILAVVGSNASDTSVAAAQIYQGKLVMITPTSFAKSLSEVHGQDDRGNYIFRTVPSIDFVVNMLSDYMIKTRKYRILMCYDGKAVDNQAFKNQFISDIDNRGVNLLPINCNFSDSGFKPSAVIKQAINDKADSIVFAPHVDRINRVLEMAQANQGRLALFGSPTLCTSQTLESRQDVNGLVIAVPWYPTAFQDNGFSRKASQLWKAPVNCWRTPMAYDATLAITTGLQQSNGTRKGLQKVLYNGFSVQGATGTVKFLPSGDRNGKGILVQVQPVKGSYDFVPLKSVSTADERR